MPSLVDPTRADQTGRDPAPRLRASLRARPRLEVLETRCLMSGWHPQIEYDDARPLPVRSPTVTAKPSTSHDLDCPGVGQPMTREGHYAASASSEEDHSSGYAVGGSRSGATTLP